MIPGAGRSASEEQFPSPWHDGRVLLCRSKARVAKQSKQTATQHGSLKVRDGTRKVVAWVPKV